MPFLVYARGAEKPGPAEIYPMSDRMSVVKKNVFNLFLKPREKEFKNALIRFCGRGLMGNVLAKLTCGNIVYIETTKKVLPYSVPEAKEEMSIETYLEFVGSFLGADFFGEIVVNILYGKITGIKVKKMYKPDDIMECLDAPGK